MLKLIANRETLVRRASEQAEFARTVEIGHFYTIDESVVDGNSSGPSRREYPRPRNSRNSTLQAIPNDPVKIGPVTGIKALESAGTLFFSSTSTNTTTRTFEVSGANITMNLNGTHDN